jgi:hypothetical protein
MTMMQDKDLNDLLGQAARVRPAPSAGLMDRVLADALAHQPGSVPVVRSMSAARPGWLSRLAAAFGGGPILAGVCASMVVGLAVGYLSPSTFDYLTSGLTGAETGTLDLFPTTDFLATEG